MNRKSLAAALVLAAAAGSALADGTAADAPAAPLKTRADVLAELQQYQQAGVNPWARNYDPLQSFRSGLTREQVTAEFLASRDEVAATTGEDGGDAWRAARAPLPTTAVVARRPVNAQ